MVYKRNVNILFLGGNRFFGKALLENLSSSKVKIYLINRGNKKNISNKNIHFIKSDRNDFNKLSKSLDGIYFDVVLDNIAYKKNSVAKLLKILKNNFSHYILTSSVMTYFDKSLNQDVVEPKSLKNIKKLSYKRMKKFYKSGEIKYALNKLKIEKYLFKTSFNFTILRIHNVVGQKDFTSKTYNFINFNIMQNSWKKKHIQFCYDKDLISILKKIIFKKNKKRQILNVCNKKIAFSNFLDILKKKKLTKNKRQILKFPFPINSIMSNKKIENYLNYKFTDPKLVVRKL